MSDLYLVLRRRLQDVTDWVELDTDILHNARKALGLSYEAMGRRLNVASKTWERWEKAGRVPRHELRRVAETLNLEIDWPERTQITVPEPQHADSDPDPRLAPLLESFAVEVARMRHLNDELEAELAPAQPSRKQVLEGL